MNVAIPLLLEFAFLVYKGTFYSRLNVRKKEYKERDETTGSV
jgi:hypothetical protein